MDNLKLARVKWFLGQTLLPEQFVSQEQALTAEADLRTRLHGLPSFGIGPPTDGNGQLLIDIPGNAVVQPLSLKASGATRVSVYLHILEQTTDATGVRMYEGDPKVVQRVMFRALLSIEKDIDRSIAMIKLAELQKEATGGWSLLSDYLPPLLQIGASPFLQKELALLLERLETLEPRLIAQLQDTFLRPDRLAVTRRTLADLLLSRGAARAVCAALPTRLLGPESGTAAVTDLSSGPDVQSAIEPSQVREDERTVPAQCPAGRDAYCHRGLSAHPEAERA